MRVAKTHRKIRPGPHLGHLVFSGIHLRGGKEDLIWLQAECICA